MVRRLAKVFFGTSAILCSVACHTRNDGNTTVAYVTNEDGRSVTVIATKTNQVIATIPVGMRPRGIHAGPGGRHIYVAISGSPRCPPTMPDSVCDRLAVDKTQDGIAEIDAATRRVVRVLPGGSDPEQFDINQDGTRLYVANEDSATLSVVDVQRGVVIAKIPVGGEPEGVRVAPDGQTVYVTSEAQSSVTAIDTKSYQVRKVVPVERRPRNVLFLPDQRHYVVSAEVGGTVQIVDRQCECVTAQIALPAGAKPMGLAVAPDGSRLYVSTGRFGQIAAIDLATQRLVGSVAVGKRPWGIALADQGATLYVANGPSNSVSVVDTKTLTVRATVPVGALPWGVTITSLP